MTDVVTRRYAEAVRTADDLAEAVRQAEQHPWLRDNPRKRRSLTRPLFVPEREINAFAADLDQLLDILVTLPQRLFDGDLHRFFRVLGVEPARAGLMSRLGGGAPQRVGRADVYHDGTAFRLLEFGIGSELGGWTFGGEIPRTMLRSRPFAEFAGAHGLAFVDTAARLAASLRRASAAAGLGDQPVVALLEAPGALTQWGGTWQLLQESMRGEGLDFRVADLEQISERDGRVWCDGTPVDIVYRCFEAADLSGSPRGAAEFELLCRAHSERRVVLWTTMEANLYGEKGCLALLSDPRWAFGFSAAERALIDRVLPWTRSLNGLDPQQTRELVEHCVRHRTELILKPNSLYGGIGVVAGWEADPETWAAEVNLGVRNGAIVQRRVVPRLETDKHRALWGVFYTPEGYAGARVFMSEEGGPAVVGLAQGKEVLAAGVFTYADAAPEGDR